MFGLFRNAQEPDAALLSRIVALETELSGLRRQLLDIEESVDRWRRRDATRARREGEAEGAPQAATLAVPSPPTVAPGRLSLRGARARMAARRAAREAAESAGELVNGGANGLHP